MSNVLKIILAIVCFAIIFVVELQSGKADGLSATITGSNKELNLFSNSKAKGSDLLLERLSVLFVVAFFALVIAIANI